VNPGPMGRADLALARPPRCAPLVSSIKMASTMPPLPPAIYVDVDDTLVRTVGSRRIPMPAMTTLVRALKERGCSLYLWSRGGADYARSVAEELGIAGCFAAFLPKPQLLLDDASAAQWSAVELHPAQCSGMSVDEVLARLKG
jgi:hypothetical protein